MSEIKKIRQLVDLAQLKADATPEGGLPTEIMLMAPGNFRTIKGDFTLGPEQFDEAVANFNRGVARVNGTSGLPINFNHEQSGPAAAWINGLENRGAEGLWGTKIEWSTMGAEQVLGGVYKFFSIEYWFGYYEEPDMAGVYYNNVVEGGAMTNIPLMRGLTPVMADKSTSGLTSGSNNNTIYVELGESPVNLQQLLAKKNEDLTADERKFLADHKSELTDEQQITFGLKADKAAEDKAAADKAAADKLAADKAAELKADADGKVSFSKEEAEQLKADAAAGREARDQLKKTEIQTALAAHVKRGALKPTSVEKWTNTLMSAAPELRATLEEQLNELGDNIIVAKKEIGGDAPGELGTAQDQLHLKVMEKVTASRTAGSPVNYSDAQKEILEANKDLAEQVTKERQTAFSN